MLFEPKYKKFMSKSINLKNRLERIFWALNKSMPCNSSKQKEAGLLKLPLLKSEEKGKESHLLLLVICTHSTNHNLEDSQGIKLYNQPPLLNMPEQRTENGVSRTDFPQINPPIVALFRHYAIREI